MKTGCEAREGRKACCPKLHHLATGTMVALVMAVAAVLVMPALSLAVQGHITNTQPAGGGPEAGCYPCHNLRGGGTSQSGAEPDTSYISSQARTILQIKSAWTTAGNPNGKDVPDNLGCTYCHNFAEYTGAMAGVLTDFVNTKNSKHPIGKTFAGVETANEYLSSYGASSNFANEMDCLDCHDPELVAVGGSYTEHHDPTIEPRATRNHYMLRDDWTAGNYDTNNPDYSAGKYDAFCRLCHATTGEGYTKAAVTALTKHADASNTTTSLIVENDGTAMQSSPPYNGTNTLNQCIKCHNSHSSGNYKMFRDSNEGGVNIAVGDANTCTQAGVCHYAGDANTNYTAHGHGMPTSSKGTTLGFKCDRCHSVDARHENASSPTKLLGYAEDTNLSKYNKSLKSVCWVCHAGYEAHKSPDTSVGCLDCHDEHAEGSGTGSNIYMIPKGLPNNWTSTELSIFEHKTTGDYDYFINTTAGEHVAGAGVCDNAVCHLGATAPDGTPFSPLSTLLGATNHHSGGNTGDAVAQGDCQSCHAHTNTGGSWDGKCDNCHGIPPVSLGTQYYAYGGTNEGLSPHAKHASPTTGYGFDCTECHIRNTDGATHNTTPTKSYQSVWFNPAGMNPGATVYTDPATTTDYTEATMKCDNLYCHSNGNATTAKNVVGAVQWMTGFTTPDWSVTDLACTSCHNNGAGQPYPNNANGVHATHMTYNGGVGITCYNCHGLTVTSGGAINLSSLPAKHVNKVKDVNPAGTFASLAVSFGWTSATKTCSAVTCHKGPTFVAADIAWTAAAACTNCHKSGTASYPTQGAHVVHAGAQPTNYGYACTRCHPNNTVTHALLDRSVSVTFAGNFVAGGTYLPNGQNGTPGDADDHTCTTTYCHGTSNVPDWDNAGPLACDSCHGSAAQANGRPNSPAAGGRHLTGSHQQVCTTCHTNNNTTKASHAQGPAAIGPPRRDAAMSATINAKAGATYTGGATAYTDRGYSYTYGTCGNMSAGTFPCHTGATWAGTGGCSFCHGYPPTTGAHTAHAGTTPPAQASCSQSDLCHVGSATYTGSASGLHMNGPIDVASGLGFLLNGATAAYGVGGAFYPGLNFGASTCTTNLCHRRELTTTYWAGTISCNACHYSTANATTDSTSAGNGTPGTTPGALSNDHNLHFDVVGRNSYCTDCHANVWADASYKTHITTGVQFVDGLNRAQALPLEAAVTTGQPSGGLGSIARAVTAGAQTCNNNICHDPSGQGKVSPAWNAAATTSCETCHNSATSPATVPAGDHAIHVTTRGYTCNECHYQAAARTDGHSNLTVGLVNASNVAITYTGTPGTYPGTYGACTANICHTDSIGANVAWGTAPTDCSQCHTSATADVNNWSGNDKIASKINGTAAAGEWKLYGHGKLTAGITCVGTNGCHDIAQAHVTTAVLTSTNPYRLKAAFTCSNTASPCHTGATVTGSNLVKSHTRADMGTTRLATWTFDSTCINCHDPHGDAANLKMMQKDLWDKAAFALNAAPPAAPTEQTNLVFTDTTTGQSTTGTSFADSDTPWSSICQECHEGTSSADTTKGWVDDNTKPVGLGANYSGHAGYVSSMADNPGDCAPCHAHSGGFKAAGHAAGSNCMGCHAGAQGTHRAVNAEFTATLSHGGAWATVTNADCEKCHLETSMDTLVLLKAWDTTGTAYTTVSYQSSNLASANTHCLSCHDATRTGTGTTLASLSPPARDLSKYTSTTTYLSHPFVDTSLTSLQKAIAKAQSPHGNPNGNVIKREEAGLTTALGCLHCHPSHGSGAGAYASKALPGGDATGATALTAKMLGGNPSALASVGLEYAGEGALSEPAICWACHDAATVNVHDYYGDTTSGTAPMHWNGGTWRTPTFTYKTAKGGVANVHIADKKDAGTADNAFANIVCTSCHDVHGSLAAQYYQPALKGKWLTSPYYEDRATNNTNIVSFARTTGGTPAGTPRAETDGVGNDPAVRGGGYSNGTGTGAWGYFIDGNTFGFDFYRPWRSGMVTQKFFTSDTNLDTASEYGGLCVTYCHPATGTPSIETNTAWTGHNAVCPSFGGADAPRDLINLTSTASTTTLRSRMVGQGWYNSTGYGCSMFATSVERLWGVRKYAQANAYSWGVNPATSGVQAGYHKFSCSKCHSPHASELPALMITNCLDVKQSTYTHAKKDEANNCHRTNQTATTVTLTTQYQSTANPRWNTVTPW